MKIVCAALVTLSLSLLNEKPSTAAEFSAAPAIEKYVNLQKSKVIQFKENVSFTNLIRHPLDSNLVFATGGNHKLILFDICLQKILWTFVRPDAYPETFEPLVFVNTRGTLVATTDLLGRVFVLDAKTGALLSTLKANVGSWEGFLPTGVLFSRDGTRLIVLASDDSVLEFDTKTFALARSKKIPNLSNGKSILETEDGNLLIADQHFQFVINPIDFSSVATYPLNSGVGASTLRRGRYLQIIETQDWSDYRPIILDVRTGSVVQKFPNSSFYPYVNDLAEDLSLAVNSSAMGDIQIFETRTARVLEELFLTDEYEERIHLNYVKFFTKSRDVLLAASMNRLVIFDSNDGFQKMCSQR